MPFPLSFEGEVSIPSRDGVPLDVEGAREKLDRCMDYPDFWTFSRSLTFAGDLRAARTALISDGAGGLVLQYRVNTVDMIVLGGILAAGIGIYEDVGGSGPWGMQILTSIGIAAVAWPLMFSGAYFIAKFRFLLWLETKVGAQLRSPG